MRKRVKQLYLHVIKQRKLKLGEFPSLQHTQYYMSAELVQQNFGNRFLVRQSMGLIISFFFSYKCLL